MDANEVLRDELERRNISKVADLDAAEIVNLAVRYSVWLPVDTYIRSPWLAPFAVRKIRIRTEPHAPGPKRDLWGLPDSGGYFTDDNSLIKSVARNRAIAPVSSPYGTGKATKGFVCCHVWPGTTNRPLLFSFVPNLVWLPADLATYSDAHASGPPHAVHDVLKAVSVHRYATATSLVAPTRVADAWALLPHALQTLPRFAMNEFIVDDRVTRLVSKRLTRITNFLAATLDESAKPPAKFSKRYHAGAGSGIDKSTWPIQQYVSAEARRLLLQEMTTCKQMPKCCGTGRMVQEERRP